jgi:hypothetical protein
MAIGDHHRSAAGVSSPSPHPYFGVHITDATQIGDNAVKVHFASDKIAPQNRSSADPFEVPAIGGELSAAVVDENADELEPIKPLAIRSAIVETTTSNIPPVEVDETSADYSSTTSSTELPIVPPAAIEATAGVAHSSANCPQGPPGPSGIPGFDGGLPIFCTLVYIYIYINYLQFPGLTESQVMPVFRVWNSLLQSAAMGPMHA